MAFDIIALDRDKFSFYVNISGVVQGWASRGVAGGCGIEGEGDGWDFGTGAGFYVDATEEKWKTNYRMYSYVTDEVSAPASCASTDKKVHPFSYLQGTRK